MALEASHIRFALAVESCYEIKNLAAYISGTIYPDSRYISKINRHLTHDFERLDNCSENFLTGWKVHLEYDLLQRKLFNEIFSQYNFEMNSKEEKWIIFTAAKIIQDMNDWRALNTDILNSLSYIETPNNEPSEFIKKYNQIIIDTYHSKTELTIDDYYAFWTKLELSREKLNILKEKTEEFLINKNLSHKIKKCFSLAVKEYKQDNLCR